MKKIITICFITILIIVSFAVGFSSKITKSQAVPAPIPFGGQLIDFNYCACSESWQLIYKGTPLSRFLGGALDYSEYDTVTYSAYKMFTLGVWHLGTYLPGAESCWEYVGVSCAPIPTLGHEIMVGTSEIPSPL